MLMRTKCTKRAFQQLSMHFSLEKIFSRLNINVVTPRMFSRTKGYGINPYNGIDGLGFRAVAIAEKLNVIKR